jgi:hypothetical protein
MLCILQKFIKLDIKLMIINTINIYIELKKFITCNNIFKQFAIKLN